MAEGVDTIACHIVTKERQPQTISELSYYQSNHYRTISLISHFSLLRVFLFYLFIYLFILLILSRVEAKGEELLAEEQTGLRPGRSTVEQIFNTRVMTEKHL